MIVGENQQQSGVRKAPVKKMMAWNELMEKDSHSAGFVLLQDAVLDLGDRSNTGTLCEDLGNWDK